MGERNFPRSRFAWSWNYPYSVATAKPCGTGALFRGCGEALAAVRSRFLCRAMGKEQELLEAARTGNLAAVEKLLSGKRQSAGSGSGAGGGASGSSGGTGGHSSSHSLSSLLRSYFL
ncbi:hypothetical protein DNTS_010935 [Danionella cerebrum]|uniref:Uncharacterized protein n=1 Tax=Danionella cerebrum TaxID=2873325 RepID=A0A553P181_9TELE|nr:hypothetical protein DNTS_010935 [Danionella translucida]